MKRIFALAIAATVIWSNSFAAQSTKTLTDLKNRLEEIGVVVKLDSAMNMGTEQGANIIAAFYQDDEKAIRSLEKVADRIHKSAPKAKKIVGRNAKGNPTTFTRQIIVHFNTYEFKVSREAGGTFYWLSSESDFKDFEDNIIIAIGVEQAPFEFREMKFSEVVHRQIALARALSLTKPLPANLETVHLLGGKPDAIDSRSRGLEIEDSVLSIEQEEFQGILDYIEGLDLAALFHHSSPIMTKGVVLGDRDAGFGDKWNVRVDVTKNGVEGLKRIYDPSGDKAKETATKETYLDLKSDLEALGVTVSFEMGMNLLSPRARALLMAFYEKDRKLLGRIKNLADSMTENVPKEGVVVATDSEERDTTLFRTLRIHFHNYELAVERGASGDYYFISSPKAYRHFHDEITITVAVDHVESDIEDLTAFKLLYRQIDFARALYDVKSLPLTVETVHLLGGTPDRFDSRTRSIRAESPLFGLQEDSFSAILQYFHGLDLFKFFGGVGYGTRGVLLTDEEDRFGEYRRKIDVKSDGLKGIEEIYKPIAEEEEKEKSR